MLANINSHIRDNHITFKEDTHEYTIEGNPIKPISVTTLVHKYFPEFNSNVIIKKMMNSNNWQNSPYYGMSAKEIKQQWDRNGKEAARLGTIMHKHIELYFNKEFSDIETTKEFNMFLEFWNDFKLKCPTMEPYRTEWLVYDEDINLAGSIDFVLSKANDEVIILDWKRSKEIKIVNSFEKGKYPFNQLDNCNYVHYTLQLNFYRHILENKYGKKVLHMGIVVLHPNQDKYKYYNIIRVDLNNIWSTLTNIQ